MAKLKIIVLSSLLGISVISAGNAQVTIDVAKITCDQFVLYKVASPDTIAVWLHGFYSGKRGETAVEVETLKSNAKKLRDYCLANGDKPVMEAVEDVFKP